MFFLITPNITIGDLFYFASENEKKPLQLQLQCIKRIIVFQ